MNVDMLSLPNENFQLILLTSFLLRLHICLFYTLGLHSAACIFNPLVNFDACI